MKKALTLALLMIFALTLTVGCEKQAEAPAAAGETPNATNDSAAASNVNTVTAVDSEATAAITEEMLKNSKPNEYIREKLDAGMEVLVGMVGIADVFTITDTFGGALRDAVEAEGCAFQMQLSNGDVSLMITQIENFITMKASLIFVVPPDTLTIKNVILEAEAAGIDTVLHGDAADYTTIVERGDMVGQGELMAKVASAWLDQNYPDAGEGEIGVALFGSTAVSVEKAKTDAIERGILADKRMSLNYFVNDIESTIDGGYNEAERAFTVDPNLKMILSFGVPTAIGANNYIIAQPNADLSQYAVFAGGTETTLEELLASAGAGEGVLRAYIGEEFGSEVYIVETCLNALFDVWVSPYEYLYFNVAHTEPNFTYPA